MPLLLRVRAMPMLVRRLNRKKRRHTTTGQTAERTADPKPRASGYRYRLDML